MGRFGVHSLGRVTRPRRAAQRGGHDIGRDQVARLMRSMQIEGISRQRRKVFTTRQDPDAVRAPDLVNRNFTADRPDALWVTDLTYVPTWSGFAYVCFIVDAYSRMIVGWRVSTSLRTDLALDALEQAIWARLGESGGSQRTGDGPVGHGVDSNTGLIAHSDAGSQLRLKESSQHCRVRQRVGDRSVPRRGCARSRCRGARPGRRAGPT